MDRRLRKPRSHWQHSWVRNMALAALVCSLALQSTPLGAQPASNRQLTRGLTPAQITTLERLVVRDDTIGATERTGSNYRRVLTEFAQETEGRDIDPAVLSFVRAEQARRSTFRDPSVEDQRATLRYWAEARAIAETANLPAAASYRVHEEMLRLNLEGSTRLTPAIAAVEGAADRLASRAYPVDQSIILHAAAALRLERAEPGDLDRAIELLETAARLPVLTAADHRALQAYAREGSLAFTRLAPGAQTDADRTPERALANPVLASIEARSPEAWTQVQLAVAYSGNGCGSHRGDLQKAVRALTALSSTFANDARASLNLAFAIAHCYDKWPPTSFGEEAVTWFERARARALAMGDSASAAVAGLRIAQAAWKRDWLGYTGGFTSRSREVVAQALVRVLPELTADAAESEPSEFANFVREIQGVQDVYNASDLAGDQLRSGARIYASLSVDPRFHAGWRLGSSGPGYDHARALRTAAALAFARSGRGAEAIAIADEGRRARRAATQESDRVWSELFSMPFAAQVLSIGEQARSLAHGAAHPPAPSFSFADIPEGAYLVRWITTSQDGVLIVADRNGRASTVDSYNTKGQTIRTALGADSGRDSSGWIDVYRRTFGRDSAETIHPFVARRMTATPDGERTAWMSTFAGTQSALNFLVWDDLRKALDEIGAPPGSRLILIPPGELAITPLSMMHVQTGQRVPDELLHLSRIANERFPSPSDPRHTTPLALAYEISFAPGLDEFAAAQHRTSASGNQSLVAFDNPTNDSSLGFARIEARAIARMFRTSHLLDTAATSSAETIAAQTESASHWHFATHGTFSWRSPELSGLALGNGARLTLADIEAMRGQPRLVVLSACESGIADISGEPDRLDGLPAAFLRAGAGGVIASLWQVEDFPTALLLLQFYDRHLAGERPSLALQHAQRWIATSTADDIQSYIDRLLERRIINESEYEELLGAVSELPASSTPDYPFAHPYYWAAFAHFGA